MIAIYLLLSSVLLFCAIVGVGHVTRYYRVAAAFIDELRHVDDSDALGIARAYALIARIRDANDERMRRGFRCLSEEEVAAILLGRPMPIQPHEFVVTERGKAVRFEDDGRVA